MHGEVLELAPKRENHREKMTGEKESTMAQLRLFQLHMCHSKTAPFSFEDVYSGFPKNNILLLLKSVFSTILIDG